MKKELSKDDILVIDGIEFTYDQLIGYLTERVVFKRQLEAVETIFKGGVTSEH